MRIGISGCSGTGKSTVAASLKKNLCEDGKNVEWFDQDTYYKKTLPKTRTPVPDEPKYGKYRRTYQPNWDVEGSIDFKKFREDIDAAQDVVIVSGFMLRNYLMCDFDLHIVLEFGEMPKNRMLEARKVSKKYSNSAKVARDEWMVENYAWPAWTATQHLLGNCQKITVYEEGERVSIDTLVQKITLLM